ncbi:hypothetical protein [Rhizobium ruizarguesonis]|uniref:hypothetical protein n=1 Tax=Rhizobium ruizarguesonis TaxID=2081791 RepID=UPI0010321B55|nr:hypothetical protein [Rhizobium ruizarguesonis]TAW18760.1 hypothetical protein ELI25_24670 [Rhizobium ruizarguesonis]TAZ54437.1 hypothetical protein ELH76_26515 [Rhizobium ruizarguesonis]
MKQIFRCCILNFFVLASSVAQADDCLPDKQVFKRDYGNDVEVFYTQRSIPSHVDSAAYLVHFEARRQKTIVWSVEGRISCGAWGLMCDLKIDPLQPNDKFDAIRQCLPSYAFKDDIIPVTLVHEDEAIKYIAFGNLTAFSMGCGNYMAIKVQRPELLDDAGRDRTFILPDYVKFDSCEK